MHVAKEVLPIYTANLQYILTSQFQSTQMTKWKIGILVQHQLLGDNVPLFPFSIQFTSV